jgi:Fe-S-cluster containining protein
MIDPEYEKILERSASRQGLYRALVKRLKRTSPKDLVSLIHSLHEEVFSVIDCLKCANCCAVVGPRLTELDIQRLGRALSMKRGEVKSAYLAVDEDGDTVFRDHPCPLLLPDRRCLVYGRRPKACREYPHTDAPEIRSLLKLSLVNSRYCPAVALIFEGLARVSKAS